MNKLHMKKTKEITVSKDESSVTNLISQAIAGNVSVETLERLFSLREKVKAEAAKEAFVAALAGFQQDCPIIKKTKDVLNKDGRTVRYSFAPIDSIVTQIKAPLLKHGISYRWEVDTKDGKVTAKAIVTHLLGHSESSSFEVPVDTEGYMTNPQKNASALTFAKRYSLCNALGIATGEEDTDATDAGQKDAKDPRTKIITRLRSLGEKTGTKDEIQEAVKRLTTLDLVKENFDEIVTRLEVVISDRHEQ